MAQLFLSLGPDDYGYIYSGSIEIGETDEYDEERAQQTSPWDEMALLGFPLVAKSFSELWENAVPIPEEEDIGD